MKTYRPSLSRTVPLVSGLAVLGAVGLLWLDGPAISVVCSIALIAGAGLVAVAAATASVTIGDAGVVVRSVRGSRHIGPKPSVTEIEVQNIVGQEQLLELRGEDGRRVTIPLGLFSSTDRAEMAQRLRAAGPRRRTSPGEA